MILRNAPLLRLASPTEEIYSCTLYPEQLAQLLTVPVLIVPQKLGFFIRDLYIHCVIIPKSTDTAYTIGAAAGFNFYFQGGTTKIAASITPAGFFDSLLPKSIMLHGPGNGTTLYPSLGNSNFSDLNASSVGVVAQMSGGNISAGTFPVHITSYVRWVRFDGFN